MPTNIFDLSSLPLSDELVTTLAESPTVRVERIVSTGQTSDWFDQAETEFVALLDGRATLVFDDGTAMNLAKGDWLIIEPHRRHRVSFTSAQPPCVWLCVFY